MGNPITKSEFLKRLADASRNYRCNFAQVRLMASSQDMIELAVKAAKDCKLPAVSTDAGPIDPIVDAIFEIGAPGEGPSHIQVMISAERAWKHLLSDRQAYVMFKELNP